MGRTTGIEWTDSTMTLRELGYPTHEELAAMGLPDEQFFDIAVWFIHGKPPTKWWRRVRPVSGLEVLAFIRSVTRPSC